MFCVYIYPFDRCPKMKTADIVGILNVYFCKDIVDVILEYDPRYNKQCIKDRAIWKEKRRERRRIRYPIKQQHIKNTGIRYIEKLEDMMHDICYYRVPFDMNPCTINRSLYKKYKNIIKIDNEQCFNDRMRRAEERLEYLKSFECIKDITPPPVMNSNGLMMLRPTKYIYYSKKYDKTICGYIDNHNMTEEKMYFVIRDEDQLNDY